MKATITVNMDNAAFRPDEGIGPDLELARILRDLANKLEFDDVLGSSCALRDYNGNRVGAMVIEA